MIATINSDLCNICSIGTYGTVLSPSDYDIYGRDGDYIREQIETAGIEYTDELLEKVLDYISSYKFDFASYRDALGRYAVKFLTAEVLPMWKKYIPCLENLDFVETWSPREYNYSTDGYVYNVKHGAGIKAQIIKFVKIEGQEFFDFCLATWGSCGGFISFMPVEKAEFLAAVYQDSSRALAMVLQYIAQKKIEENFEEKFLYEICENVDCGQFHDFECAVEKAQEFSNS